MILLVPIAPESPRAHSRQIWPGLVLVLILAIGFIEALPYLENDAKFVMDLYAVNGSPSQADPVLRPDLSAYLRLRPLLKIAPSPASWDARRLLLANFIHGSGMHLALNLVAAFAGARICATFLPFLCTLSIFIIGGSIGFLVSLLFSSSGPYSPHLGASAGIFALMGTYYVYNFRYRTRYFFWFPSRRASTIALRTSWFFFLDVLLLELLVSTAQLFPTHRDGVDHLAHVFGFGAGMGLAYLLRLFQRWPSYLQTRGEYLIWTQQKKNPRSQPFISAFERWVELLEVNPCNDRVKEILLTLLTGRTERLDSKQLTKVFSFIGPTYVRLHGKETAKLLRELLAKNIAVPTPWLKRMPYDSIIQLAKFLANPADEQHLLFKLVDSYRAVQTKRPETDKKLAILLAKLGGLAEKPRTRSEAARGK